MDLLKETIAQMLTPEVLLVFTQPEFPHTTSTKNPTFFLEGAEQIYYQGVIEVGGNLRHRIMLFGPEPVKYEEHVARYHSTWLVKKVNGLPESLVRLAHVQGGAKMIYREIGEPVAFPKCSAAHA